jgi:hypothetical protein
MKAEKSLSALDPENDNFFSIIEKNKNLRKNNDWWVISEKDR